jgi:hypothetical protein
MHWADESVGLPTVAAKVRSESPTLPSFLHPLGLRLLRPSVGRHPLVRLNCSLETLPVNPQASLIVIDSSSPIEPNIK